MAGSQRWYPSDESDRVPWLNNYSAKLAVHGALVGIDPTEIAATQADIAFLVWVYGVWYPAVKSDMKEFTAYKALVAKGGVTGLSTVPVPTGTLFPSPPAPPVRAPGIETRLFLQVKRIKTKIPGYTEQIGMDLGVIGAEPGEGPLFPEFTAKVETGPLCQCVRLDFVKSGHMGVFIESRRNGGAWEFLAIDTLKPYIDERPLLVPGAAETREYRMRFWDQGEANGDFSPVQKVNVGPV